jgi:hypothetical protein
MIGLTYFETFRNNNKGAWILLYSHTLEGICVEHHSVLKYGHLRPHRERPWNHATELVCYHTVVTTDASHLNALYWFI